MTIDIRPLSDALGAEISGVDLSTDLAGETFAEIRQAWLDHCLLLFRGIDWTPEQQIAFTRRFGPLHIMTPLHCNLPDHPEIFRISNLVEQGKDVGLRRGGWGWHSDGEDKQIPNAGSLLYARCRRKVAIPALPTCTAHTRRCPRPSAPGSRAVACGPAESSCTASIIL
jgi:taurine dioxygenase